MKSLFAIAMVSLFSIVGRPQVLASGGRSGQLQNETEFYLAVKSKCKASANSYKCKGGIKFDEQKLSDWKKDPLLPNYYEYTGPVEPDLFKSHEDKRTAFLKKACVSDHFEIEDMRDIFTCTENNKKQQIIFEVKRSKGSYELVCDAAGGATWLKMIYPKAVWTEAPKTPHYYRAQDLKKEQIEELSEFIRQSVLNPPAGCRRLDCPIGAWIPDGCEQEKP